MSIRSNMTVRQLVKEMDRCGVLGAGRLARATNLIKEMFDDPEYTVFLTLAGPMIPGGLRKIVCDLIAGEYVNVIVASGANIVHDVIEALNHKGVRGSFLANDVKLREKGIGRAGDIFFEQKGFEALEKYMYKVLNTMLEKGVDKVSICKLLFETGKMLDDRESILRKASDLNMPMFSPGLLDSMIGLHLWTFNQLKKLQIDPLIDMNQFSDIIYSSKKIGVIILGGGLPKHYTLGASILREGVDAAVQVTLDRPEGGSLSGAPLEEAISWKKAKTRNKLETVIGDATIIFPLMIAAILEKQ
ncbi:MAG: deoxyhypusine synthase [Candidatus Bathyarchaeota archaeon]